MEAIPPGFSPAWTMKTRRQMNSTERQIWHQIPSRSFLLHLRHPLGAPQGSSLVSWILPTEFPLASFASFQELYFSFRYEEPSVWVSSAKSLTSTDSVYLD